jgi:two-component system C4-dicarboxylate transport response regulator DctD
MRHAWPGNVRELRHAAERHVLGLPILSDDAVGTTVKPCLAVQLSHVEREVIRAALARHETDNRGSGSLLRAAASELGVSPKTLTRRMAALGLDLRDAETHVIGTLAFQASRPGFVTNAGPSDGPKLGQR